MSTNNRQSTAKSLQQRLEPVTDLATLSPVSDDIIVSCLRERFMTDNVYTAIGSSALVAVNPHKYISTNADSVLQKYAAEYRDTSGDKEPLAPHVFQLANNAFYHMRRTNQDQCILMRCVAIFCSRNWHLHPFIFWFAAQFFLHSPTLHCPCLCHFICCSGLP